MKKLLIGLIAGLLLLGGATSATAQNNYQGTWWDSTKNGMGLFVGHQGNTVFAAWFHYSTTNQPTFLIFAGPLQKDAQLRDTYSGALYRSFGPPPMNYDATKVQTGVNVGTMTIAWNSASSATMTYNYDGGSQVGTFNLTPFQIFCPAPTMWNGTVCIAPMFTKVVGANQLPQGCNTWKDQCWKDSVANGTVKFVATTAKLTGINDRPLMIAYFRNTTTMLGVTGFWNTFVVYADDGSPIGSDIGGGVSQEIDKVYGVSDGIIRHTKDTGTCGKGFYNPVGKIWDYAPIACPSDF